MTRFRKALAMLGLAVAVLAGGACGDDGGAVRDTGGSGSGAGSGSVSGS